ncbi:unnamed protein product, partial [Larinioides sclopetarius]
LQNGGLSFKTRDKRKRVKSPIKPNLAKSPWAPYIPTVPLILYGAGKYSELWAPSDASRALDEDIHAIMK